MSARLFFRDAGGVPRQLKRIAMRDAGGTTRMLKRLFECDANGVPRLIYRAQIAGTFTLTATEQTGGNGSTFYTYTWSGDTTFSDLTGGYVAVAASSEEEVSGSNTAYSSSVYIRGPDLGIGGLNTVNGIAPAGYSYDTPSGIGTWDFDALIFSGTGTHTITIA